MTVLAERIEAPWLAAEVSQRVMLALGAHGRSARFVGGCVRDALLDPEADIQDIDIATPELPEQAMALLSAAGLRAKPTGLHHGTVSLHFPGRRFEITTLRRDVACDGRHAEVEFTDDFDADAARRDFTINAMSCEPDGTLHDPMGGRADLAAGRVRFVGDARRRITEDHLRILRFFRFEGRFGRGAPDEEALSACAAMADRGIDVVLFNHLPSICYLSGYQTPATSDHNCLFVTQDGRIALQVIEHEIPNAVLTGWVEDVRGFSWYQPDTIPTQTVSILSDLTKGRRSLTIGIEQDRPGMTVKLFGLLQSAFPLARIVDASDLLNAQRAVKSTAEIAYLRESGRISVLGA